jgi:hypothetical protein
MLVLCHASIALPSTLYDAQAEFLSVFFETKQATNQQTQ